VHTPARNVILIRFPISRSKVQFLDGNVVGLAGPTFYDGSHSAYDGSHSAPQFPGKLNRAGFKNPGKGRRCEQRDEGCDLAGWNIYIGCFICLSITSHPVTGVAFVGQS
jgi:hypothetical protein